MAAQGGEQAKLVELEEAAKKAAESVEEAKQLHAGISLLVFEARERDVGFSQASRETTNATDEAGLPATLAPECAIALVVMNGGGPLDCLVPAGLLYTALASCRSHRDVALCALVAVAGRFWLCSGISCNCVGNSFWRSRAACNLPSGSAWQELCGVLIGYHSISALYVRTDVAAKQTPMLQSVVKMFSNGHGLPGFAPEH